MKYKIENILACVDSSQYSTTLMKYSAYIAKAFEAKIEALHVIDILQLEGPFMYDVSGALGLEPFSNFSGKIKSMLEEKGKNVLSSFKEITDFYGVELNTKMEMGVVSSVIVEEADSFDIVFIGRKGINASYERGILGSNIEPVIRKIEKPLFISNEHFYTPRTLVVAYDGSSVSNKALEFAKLYKEKFDVGISIVYVGNDKKVADELFSELPTYFDRKFIESDDVANAVADFTELQDNALLVIGAYSKNRILEMILGSTTEAILRKELQFPLMVVR
jgi:nucleotide-binding universal stress UspA family protein